MKLDKESHRNALLELIDKATFPGSARKIVTELADAIESAEVAEHPSDTPSEEVRHIRSTAD